LTIGDIFQKFVPSFKDYSIYVQGYEKSQQKIFELCKDKNFASFLDKRKELEENITMYDISSYLIEPVQR
jgi:hypothetical protein